MPIKQRGSSWQAAVSHKGKRYRKDFPTKHEAELWAAQKKADLLAGRDTGDKPVEKEMTLQELFELVYETRWKGTKGGKTAHLNARHVVEILGASRPVSSLCYEDVLTIKKTVAGWQRSDATINRKLAAFSTMCKEAFHLKKLPALFPVGLIKEKTHRVRFFENEELNRMIEWCDEMCEDELRDYIILSVDTGFRQGEILRIEKRDIRVAGDLWTFNTKAGDNRDVPLTARAKELLLRRAATCSHPEEKLFKQKPDWYRDHWKQMQSDLGMTDDRNYVPHVLRHTFVTNVLQFTDLKTAQELAGHKRIETTQRYAHTSAERKRLAIAKLAQYQGADTGA